MKILVIGASSYVGAKIYSDLSNDVIGTYYSNKLFDELEKLDITKREDVISFINEIKPNLIIHVAANASGGWCEKNPKDAIDLNENGTGYIVEAANQVGAKIIYISSMAVVESDRLYGRTKLNSEHLVEKTIAGYIILRPSLIVGYSPNTTNDRPFNRLLRNLLDNVPAVYDNSWKFQPTYLRHISEVIQKLIENWVNGKIIPIAVPEITTRYDLAKDILTPFGVNVESEDKKNNSPILKEGMKELKELKLPEYTYPKMIKEIIKEIEENFNLEK